jgi:hypothetical protein
LKSEAATLANLGGPDKRAATLEMHIRKRSQAQSRRSSFG